MKTLVDQLGQYAEYHRDRRNIATHFVGIPLIVVAVAVLLSRPGTAAFGLWLSPAALVEQNHLRLDDLRNRLGSALRASTQLRREALRAAGARLAATSPEKRVQLESHRLLALWKRLESASPQSVLKRGYAIVRDESGRPIGRAKATKPGQPLVTEFHDGKVRVRVEKEDPTSNVQL